MTIFFVAVTSLQIKLATPKCIIQLFKLFSVDELIMLLIVAASFLIDRSTRSTFKSINQTWCEKATAFW